MKGPFFQEDRINYIIRESESNFDDVDMAIDKIKESYDVKVKEKIEGLDTYWIVAEINKKHCIRIRYHDLVGLSICSINKESNNTRSFCGVILFKAI